MLDEFLQDEELGRIAFARILNQNGVNTGVNTDKVIEEYLNKKEDGKMTDIEEVKQTLIKAIEGIDTDEMEDIPLTLRQLEEKHREDEPEESLDELEERELSGDELEKIKQELCHDLSDPEQAARIVKKAFEDLLEEHSKHPKGDEPEIQLAEPDYYAGNGLSPLEAFKKGLLSREGTIGFIKGNVIKYTVRAGHKHNASEDIVKAIDYLVHLKELYEKEMRCRDDNTIIQESKRLFQEALAGLDNIKDVEVRDY